MWWKKKFKIFMGVIYIIFRRLVIFRDKEGREDLGES